MAEIREVTVFISWSGDESRQVAEALEEWLPMVLQNVRPWVSSQGVSAGDLWRGEVQEKLQGADFGVICLNADNIDRPWLNFEAGAMSSKVRGTNAKETPVIPYLTDLSPAATAHGPLSVFRAVTAGKRGTRSLIDSLNRECGVKDAIVANAFRTFWPRLEKKLDSLARSNSQAQSDRNEADPVARIEAALLELSVVVGGIDERVRKIYTRDPIVSAQAPAPTWDLEVDVTANAANDLTRISEVHAALEASSYFAGWDIEQVPQGLRLSKRIRSKRPKAVIRQSVSERVVDAMVAKSIDATRYGAQVDAYAVE